METYNIEEKKRKNRPRKSLFAILVAVLLCLALSSCGGKVNTSLGSNVAKSNELLNEYPKSDMSGYAGLKGYEQETLFVDVTVDDIEKLMKDKASFVVYAGFSDCPWCNALIAGLNDVAQEEDIVIAYLDTRKNPEWTNNMDIDDYDKLVKYFGEWIGEDANGDKHLYVPELFFVNSGEPVFGRAGLLEGLSSPTDRMTDDQIQALNEELKACVDLIR